MKIKIITDSACDIPYEYKPRNIDILNFYITIDGESYEERKDFNLEDFYSKLENCEGIPATAHITMLRFCEHYEKLFNEGVTDIIVVTINKGGSATYDAALMAKDNFFNENPNAGISITVLDSTTYSVGYGYPIICADDMIDNGATPEKIIEFLLYKFHNTEILLATYSLKFMKKSGRISAAAAFAGELMGFRPIISMKDNKTTVLQKVRGDKLVIPNLIAQAKQRCKDTSEYVIAYTSMEYRDDLYNACVQEFGVPPKAEFRLGCAVSINAGPHSLGIAYLDK